MELEGKELNDAVALALGWEHPGAVGKTEPTTDGTPWCLSGCNDWWRHPVEGWLCSGCYGFPYRYSSDWAIGGPIIECERIELSPSKDGQWFGDIGSGRFLAKGVTPLVAAMRAFVASKK